MSDLVIETNNAAILASGALLVSNMVGAIVFDTTKLVPSIEGNLATPDTIDEMVLSRLQTKLIRKAD